MTMTMHPSKHNNRLACLCQLLISQEQSYQSFDCLLHHKENLSSLKVLQNLLLDVYDSQAKFTLEMLLKDGRS